MLSGNNGILQKATDAKTKSDEAQIRERIQLAYHSALTRDITGENGELTKPTLQEELDNEFKDKTVTITPNEDKTQWTIKVDDIEVIIPAGKDAVQVATLPSAEGTTPYFPSSSFSQVEGTDLSTGLVITDEVDENGNSKGNEYVWIEVPRTVATYGNSFNLNYDFDSMTEEQKNTAYTAISTALRNYVSDIISVGTSTDSNKTTTSGYIDEWYDGCGILNQEEYTKLYNTMLKSVYKNGGFWIGRYEAGMTGNTGRTDENASIDGIIPLSKPNLIPIFYVNCGQAQIIATRAQDKGSYNSSLMFGIQWDLMLKHLKNKGVSTSLLISDSTNCGNYENTTNATLNDGKYTQYANFNGGYNQTFNEWHSYNEKLETFIEDGVLLKNAGMPQSILLSTGMSEKFNLKNIYDIAGNLFEFTIEQANYINNPNSHCTYRGGGYLSNGSLNPISGRWAMEVTADYCHRISCNSLLNSLSNV